MTSAEYMREWRKRHPDYMRDWYRANKDRVRGYAAKRRAKQGLRPKPIRKPGRPKVERTALERSLMDRAGRFGVTVSRLHAMMAEQDGKCAACDRQMTWTIAHVDHDHRCCPAKGRSCGQCVTALLCPQCNGALGHVNDDVERLVALIEYVVLHDRGPYERGHASPVPLPAPSPQLVLW